MRKIITTSMLILLLLISTNGQGVDTSKTYVFDMGNNYEMESNVSAPLIWSTSDNSTKVTVNITLTQIPDAISGISIDAIAYYQHLPEESDDESGQQISFDSIVPDEQIFNISKTYTYSRSLTIPSSQILVEEFYLNVTIFARTLGNITQSDAVQYSMRFPDTGTILVDRENDQVPLINLYGFPPESFFLKWVPIYAVIFVVLLSPAYISLFSYINNRRPKQEEEQ